MITSRNIIHSNHSLTILNSSIKFFSTNINSNITSSTNRNLNSNHNRLTLLSFTNSNIHTRIILRSSNISLNSRISMTIITRINHLNIMDSRSHISNIDNSYTINNSSIKLFITDFNSNITSSIITNDNNHSTITMIHNNNI